MSEWQIIEEEFISYTGGTAQLISNGECEIHLWETPKDAQLFCDKLNAINEENEHYKSIFFELVETALTDKNCRELYCKGILDIFDKANSLNQARDMIKEYLK